MPRDESSFPRSDSGGASPQIARSVTDEFAERLESYRGLLDNAHAIVWRAAANTFRFTFVSRYAEVLLGYPIHQWINESGFWSEHLHPDDRESALAFRARTATENRTQELEYRMMTAAGHFLWLRDIVRVVMENDQPRELVGVMMDITKEKGAQQALEQSEQSLKKVIDTIPQQIWSGLPDGTLDFCNARWRNELGLSLDDIQGEGWQRMLHPDDRTRVLRTWHDSVTQGIPYEQRERHLMATGQYRWFLCRGIPLRDAEGKIVRWFGSNTDVEDQTVAESALHSSERRWRGAFGNTRVGVALQDSGLGYVDANPAFCNMVGYSLDELKTFTCLQITYPEDQERFQATIDELLTGKINHFEVEKRYVCKNGDLVWARQNGSMVTTDEVPYWVVMVENITDRKRLSDQLQLESVRLRLLLDLNRKFVSHLDIYSFFNALSRSLSEIDGWEYAFVALPEAMGQLQVYLANPSMRELSIGLSLPVEGTFAGNVYLSAQSEFFRVADLRPVPGNVELTRWREFAQADGLQSGCNLPLVYDGEVVGVLGFHTRRDIDSARRDLPFLQELAKLVAIALHNARRYGELVDSHQKLEFEKSYIEAGFLRDRGIAGIIGSSPAVASVIRQIDAVAPTDSTVLISGETGTGKELVARAIHARSSRQDQSFIKVDCAAIPAALMESELFGHEKGAFTGAIAQKLGRFEVADHGTIFLDEIGDLPFELQAKLLRVLQDSSFERLGSNRTRHVDVRIVAATNSKLEEMVASKRFREDLYYRLKVFPILVPPLRERRDDIPLLVQHYVALYAHKMKKEIPIVPAKTMEILMRYPWPGNVRELQHFVERSVVISRGRILHAPITELKWTMAGRELTVKRARAQRSMQEIERDSILEALQETDWVIGGPDGAAAKLGLKRTTLSSRMERLGISRRK